MEINYEKATTLSISKSFPGETEDGRKFTIYALWDDWDDWSVDRIEFEESEGSEEDEQEIIDRFLEDMN